MKNRLLRMEAKGGGDVFSGSEGNEAAQATEEKEEARSTACWFRRFEVSGELPGGGAG